MSKGLSEPASLVLGDQAEVWGGGLSSWEQNSPPSFPPHLFFAPRAFPVKLELLASWGPG